MPLVCGRVYQQTFIDTYTKVACAKLYDRKTPITAADLLAAMAERLDEIGAPVPFGGLTRVGLKALSETEQLIPEPDEVAINGLCATVANSLIVRVSHRLNRPHQPMEWRYGHVVLPPKWIIEQDDQRHDEVDQGPKQRHHRHMHP